MVYFNFFDTIFTHLTFKLRFFSKFLPLFVTKFNTSVQCIIKKVIL
jgi:hypothetical protein